MDELRTARLRQFFERGGHLILTIRCEMKDKYNALLPSRQPGPLSELAGVEVEDYYALLDPFPITRDWFEGESQLWAERLNPIADDIQILAREEIYIFINHERSEKNVRLPWPVDEYLSDQSMAG